MTHLVALVIVEKATHRSMPYILTKLIDQPPLETILRRVAAAQYLTLTVYRLS